MSYYELNQLNQYPLLKNEPMPYNGLKPCLNVSN